MKKLTLLITLVLMTLTAISQTISPDIKNTKTTKNIVADTAKLFLKPITTSINGIEYKAFTFPQSRLIIKELATLQYLDMICDLNNGIITELKSQNLSLSGEVSAYKTIDTNNQKVISNQSIMVNNLNAVIHIKDNTIRSQRTKLLIGGVLSVGIIAALLIR